MRFKSLVVKANGKSRTYSKDFIDRKKEQHPSDWWDHLSDNRNDTGDVGIDEPAPVTQKVLSDKQHPESSVEETTDPTEGASNENSEDTVADVPAEEPDINLVKPPTGKGEGGNSG